ncbi:MAG: SgcJ/EcaC family oxidoreductase [Syntrophotaleaceae bacterium]
MTQSILTEVREVVSAENENFMEAFKRGDAAGLADLYTENGQVLAPNCDLLTGKKAIQAFWQTLFDMGIKGIKLKTVEVEIHGDTAIEVSNYTVHGEEGQEFDRGKYIVIWKQEKGRWKLHRDIYNSSMPAPQK